MLIMIGKIVNTKGLKGEVKVLSSSDFKEQRFKKKAKLILKNKSEEIEVEISDWKVHKGFDILKFKGYNFIDEVEKYKNWEIYAQKLDEQVLDENQYFTDDLLNLNVYDSVDKEHQYGVVVDVYDIVNRTYLKIKMENSMGKEIKEVNGTRAKKNQEQEQTLKSIPFVPEFIHDVDLEQNRLEIANIPGLLDD